MVTDERRRVLLIWPHRFITDSWGREIPVGKIEDGEAGSRRSARGREGDQLATWATAPAGEAAH